MPLREPTVRLLRLILLISLSILTFGSTVNATPSEDAYKEVDDLLKKGDYKGALVAMDKAISLHPIDARAYSARAAAYQGLGQDQKAVDDCSKALELDPKDAKAYNVRGTAYVNLGKPESA